MSTIKELVARYYSERGYTVEKEVSIGKGKAVDLIAFRSNEKTAIEVETGKSNAIDNISKCLKENFYRIVSIAVNQIVSKKIQDSLQSMGLHPNLKNKCAFYT